MMRLRGWSFGLPVLLFLLAIGPQALAGEVVFDQAHGQRFVIEKQGPLQLSLLAEMIASEGGRVRSNTAPLTGAGLEEAVAVVISGPFRPLAEREIAAVLNFVEQGGRLAVMLHVGAPLVPLLHRLGVDVANGVVRQTEEAIGGKSLDFRVSDLAPHPIHEGVGKIAFFGAWPLRGFSPGVRTVARSAETSWVDLDGDRVFGKADVRQSFSLVVAGRIGRGEFVVFGDDALFQNVFLRDHNEGLARGLAAWLTAAGARRQDGETE